MLHFSLTIVLYYEVFANSGWRIAMIQAARRPKTLGSQVQTPRNPCSNQLIGSTCTYIFRLILTRVRSLCVRPKLTVNIWNRAYGLNGHPHQNKTGEKKAMEFAYSFIFFNVNFSRNIFAKTKKFLKIHFMLELFRLSFVSVKCLIHTKL